MDVTMIGLQNAGKTSLLRVLAVSLPVHRRPMRSCDRPVAVDAPPAKVMSGR